MIPYHWSLLAAAVMTLSGGIAQAQNCLGRPDFDTCMAAGLGNMQRRNAAEQQQIWQRYLRDNGPWLQERYSQYRGPMTFEQFAYWNLMSANGTNIPGATRAQEDQFRGRQAANATVQQGFSDYRQGMYANSDRTSRAAENYDQGAIRGNTALVDPQTGQTQWLPYAQPYNQPFPSGGRTYLQNENGYFVWDGGGWTLLQPRR